MRESGGLGCGAVQPGGAAETPADRCAPVRKSPLMTLLLLHSRIGRSRACVPIIVCSKRRAKIKVSIVAWDAEFCASVALASTGMARGVERHCSVCRATLSRFNVGLRCGPCQGGGAAPRVGREFWVEPAVVAAIRAWDLGVVVRLFRQHTGLSQASVARLVNIDQAEVSRLERGRKKIRDRRQLAQWSEALGVPDGLLGPLPDADRPSSMANGGTSVNRFRWS